MVNKTILNSTVKAVNIGAELFADALRAQGVDVIQLQWRPRAGVSAKTRSILEKLSGNGNLSRKISEANQKAVDSILTADPRWIDMKPAIEVIPGMKKDLILKSGPPLPWERLCDTQKMGVVNGIFYENLAGTKEEAIELIKSGKVKIGAANDHGIVGPGAGIVTPSMIVNVVEDVHSGKQGFCAPFEGPNKGGLSGWGIYNEAVKAHLDLLRDIIGPVFSKLLKKAGGIPIKNIIAKGLEMGDENHTRQEAGGLILINQLFPLLIKAGLNERTLRDCVDFLYKTPRFFHPIGMASAMTILQAVKDIEYSTVVWAQAGNGVEYGIKVSGLGEQWFTADAPILKGMYLSSEYKPEDSLPWIGDSCILEAIGLGGFAAAAAPSVARLIGGDFQDAINQSREMEEICLTANRNFPIPALDYQGPPAGVDIRKVLETGIEPILHGGIISKTGKRIGAGTARIPLNCFEKALEAFAEKYNIRAENTARRRK